MTKHARRSAGSSRALVPAVLTALSPSPLTRMEYWLKVPYMEMDMELSKKTTILFPPDLHRHLSELATERGTSLGKLVRMACEKEYGFRSCEARLQAVRAIVAMSLPVSTPRDMKMESVGFPEEPLP